MAIKTVGVLGCGLMGAGIAQVSAAAGFKTIVLEVNEDVLKKGLGRIEKFLTDGVAKGKVTDAIIENVELKKQAYAQVEGIVGPHCLIASNTSSLCITELGAGTKRPDKVGGLHFFNPVPVMKLVEVIRALATSQDTHDALMGFAKAIGKEPISAPDRGGFIVNRLLVPYLLDAIRCFEEGLGTAQDIDNGMKLGCGHPMGPLTLLDFVGLDTTYYIANIMFEEFREARFAPPPLLKRMVLAGHLGKKSGKGFYDYAAK
jgi:3-hydroxybutyryl-CoA dehydrogenase